MVCMALLWLCHTRSIKRCSQRYCSFRAAMLRNKCDKTSEPALSSFVQDNVSDGQNTEHM